MTDSIDTFLHQWASAERAGSPVPGAAAAGAQS
jgi:hypothetical protein